MWEEKVLNYWRGNKKCVKEIIKNYKVILLKWSRQLKNYSLFKFKSFLRFTLIHMNHNISFLSFLISTALWKNWNLYEYRILFLLIFLKGPETFQPSSHFSSRSKKCGFFHEKCYSKKFSSFSVTKRCLLLKGSLCQHHDAATCEWVVIFHFIRSLEAPWVSFIKGQKNFHEHYEVFFLNFLEMKRKNSL